MIYRSLSYCFLSLLLCACVTGIKHEVGTTIDRSYLDYVNNSYNDKFYKYQNDMTLFIDGVEVDSTVLDTMIDNHLIQHVYVDYFIDRNASVTQDSSEKEFKEFKNYSMSYYGHAFTPKYLEARQFEPSEISLQIDHNSLMFLNLISDKKGEMDAVVYDIASGKNLASYNRTNYDGGFYLGNRVDTTDLDNLRCIVTIDGHFAEKEFEYKSIRI